MVEKAVGDMALGCHLSPVRWVALARSARRWGHPPQAGARQAQRALGCPRLSQVGDGEGSGPGAVRGTGNWWHWAAGAEQRRAGCEPGTRASLGHSAAGLRVFPVSLCIFIQKKTFG